MASIEVKNFTNGADEVSTPSNARVETVNVGGQRVIKLTVQPGGSGQRISNQLLVQKAVKLSTSASLSRAQ